MASDVFPGNNDVGIHHLCMLECPDSVGGCMYVCVCMYISMYVCVYVCVNYVCTHV